MILGLELGFFVYASLLALGILMLLGALTVHDPGFDLNGFPISFSVVAAYLAVAGAVGMLLTSMSVPQLITGVVAATCGGIGYYCMYYLTKKYFAAHQANSTERSKDGW